MTSVFATSSSWSSFLDDYTWISIVEGVAKAWHHHGGSRILVVSSLLCWASGIGFFSELKPFFSDGKTESRIAYLWFGVETLLSNHQLPCTTARVSWLVVCISLSSDIKSRGTLGKV